ncbi:MAG: hypothetical protein M1836_002478 [Candelina mexicana]|nr:MAG: hypothetical protein M1836_002478 [Candelina mexicana]
MRFFTTLGLAAGLIAQATAQTPPGTSPSTNNNLNVSFDGTRVTPGIRLARESTLITPTFNFVPTSSNQSFIIFLIDLSLSTTTLNISSLNASTQLPLAPGIAANRTAILHFEQQGVRFAANGSLINSTIPVAYYLPPNPPAGDIAHTYVFYLFEQQAIFRPTNVTLSSTVASRVSFNIANFSRTAGVGPLLAANYFTVQNNATANATGTAGATASRTSGVATGTGGAIASVTPFRGAAGTLATGVQTVVAGVFAAALAGLML